MRNKERLRVYRRAEELGDVITAWDVIPGMGPWNRKGATTN